MTRSTPQQLTDPSVRTCAAALIVEAMESINVQVRDGAAFYVARDSALEEMAPGWIARYGREAADAAVRGLHMLAPHEILDGTTKAIEADRRADLHAAALARQRGGGGFLNRVFLRCFNRPLYGLGMAMLIALATLHVPAPVLARGDAHPPSRWRALALCGVSKPGPARDRACRHFNSGERTARGYDAPRGTPRSWELPRSWEIDP